MEAHAAGFAPEEEDAVCSTFISCSKDNSSVSCLNYYFLSDAKMQRCKARRQLPLQQSPPLTHHNKEPGGSLFLSSGTTQRDTQGSEHTMHPHKHTPTCDHLCRLRHRLIAEA